jgi:hypothetical protein
MPTPRPCSGLRSRGVNQTELQRALTLLPTPCNQSQSGGVRLEGGSAARKKLKAALLATPLARDFRSGKTSKATAAKNSRPLSEQACARGIVGTADLLRLVEWMMGFPPRWLLDAALAVPVSPPTATRSSRSSPSLSAAPSSTSIARE